MYDRIGKDTKTLAEEREEARKKERSLRKYPDVTRNDERNEE